ncbi:MAG: hypothetical protein K2O94_01565, partial [Clostridiales bacterium]|nr:hypothetical protein [Clostridiales bacterium]
MTDEEIEKTLRRNADNIGGGFDSKVLDYINRLKAKNKELQDKNRRVLDWKRREEKLNNEMIDRFDEELKKSKEQIRKNTAKELLDDLKEARPQGCLA